MLGLIIVAVLFLAVIAYVVWEYRQGSFPKSRLKKNAKRAARSAWELNREDRKHRPDSEQNTNERTD
jgi:hypothetical protein